VSSAAKMGSEGDSRKARMQKSSPAALATHWMAIAFLRLDPILSSSQPAHGARSSLTERCIAGRALHGHRIPQAQPHGHAEG
jgi:hypothetical protein